MEEESEFLVTLQHVKFLFKDLNLKLFFNNLIQKIKSSLVFKFGNFILCLINDFLIITVDRPISHDFKISLMLLIFLAFLFPKDLF